MGKNPNVTNIACDRLDVYSKRVRVGPPALLPTNKIHRRHDYVWTQPIYEHLWFKHKDRNEVEIYNEDIYLIHDQDFKKPERSELYIKMLEDEYQTNPTNCWTLWYLLDHYYKTRNLNSFIDAAIIFVTNSHHDERYDNVKSSLTFIYHNVDEASVDQKTRILKAIQKL